VSKVVCSHDTYNCQSLYSWWQKKTSMYSVHGSYFYDS